MASCPWVASILKNCYLEVGGLNNLPNVAVSKGPPNCWDIVGFLRVPGRTLNIPREDWGTLGKIRGITTPPVRILLGYVDLILGCPRHPVIPQVWCLIGIFEGSKFRTSGGPGCLGLYPI